ncbi:potassium channel family protein [Sedimentimonas flavescens]|uniref:Potassium channel family protein n=1 Tax=Sedimentimonas flavescens TaxID=2851012 RepID=A0ABT2ZZX1_9RHOB|nr:ion channel [Sedimentimonas flavescens]MBW0158580.1 potassium channel family protein [Sedimentimonas flavescens]MCT2540877.1 potassium channel family protein [Sedimentimonas flavescens]MCV2879265.1 potassium channel family protein [Sedimentimonas flavescens]WBL32887.1 ion channel [Sinirhodobacter sp. HNIBRBA609]
MFLQLFIGSVIMVMTVIIAALSAWGMEWAFARSRPWLLREPHRPKLILVVLVTALWALAMVTAGVWLWAFCFRALGIFITMEAAVYFALVSYTTLGYGDILLTHEWRILGGMAAANGLLNIGLLTALLVEALRQVRLSQLQAHLKRGEG